MVDGSRCGSKSAATPHRPAGDGGGRRGHRVVADDDSVAGALGTAVFDSQHRRYVQQAHTRHRVAATVAEDSDAAGTVEVMASWITERGGRTSVVEWKAPVKRGDRIQVWVDASGDAVDPPTPIADAGFDAAAVGMVMVAAVVVMAGSLAAATRCWLDRIRDGQWESQLRTLVGDDGGRINGTGRDRLR